MAGPSTLDRRAFLQTAGLAAGGLATLGMDRLLSGRVSDWSFEQTARALVESLSPLQRRTVMLPWDHASRGVVSHVACMSDAPRVADTLTVEQQVLVHRLYETMTSAEQRHRFGRLVGLEAGGLDPCALVIYGDPFEGAGRDFQVTLSGGHLLIRGGGITEAGSAFGGPLGYGHQIGDGVPRLPGNTFAYHGDALNTLVAGLPEASRRRALVAGAPLHETTVQLQGAAGEFHGLPVRSLGEAERASVAELVDVVLSCYADADREAAWGCLRRNGDVESLHLTVWSDLGLYDDGASFAELSAAERGRRGAPYWHVWRLEGPGTVVHFRGWPHVHASIHLADDGGAGQNVGAVIAEAPRLLQDAELRPLLRTALADATGERLAYIAEGIPARFVPGPVATGTVWNLDPFDGEVGVMAIRGEAMAAPVRAAAEAQGETVADGRTYRLAIPALFAGDASLFGEPEDVEATGLRTRGVYETWIRRNGLAPA